MTFIPLLFVLAANAHQPDPPPGLPFDYATSAPVLPLELRMPAFRTHLRVEGVRVEAKARTSEELTRALYGLSPPAIRTFHVARGKEYAAMGLELISLGVLPGGVFSGFAVAAAALVVDVVPPYEFSAARRYTKWRQSDEGLAAEAEAEERRARILTTCPIALPAARASAWLAIQKQWAQDDQRDGQTADLVAWIAGWADAPVRRTALRLLGERQDRLDRVTPLLSDADPNARVDAARAITTIALRTNDSTASDLLTKLAAEDPAEVVRREAAANLRRLQQRSAP